MLMCMYYILKNIFFFWRETPCRSQVHSGFSAIEEFVTLTDGHHQNDPFLYCPPGFHSDPDAQDFEYFVFIIHSLLPSHSASKHFAAADKVINEKSNDFLSSLNCLEPKGRKWTAGAGPDAVSGTLISKFHLGRLSLDWPSLAFWGLSGEAGVSSDPDSTT